MKDWIACVPVPRLSLSELILVPSVISHNEMAIYVVN